MKKTKKTDRHSKSENKAAFAFYASYVFCMIVFALTICALTYIFGTGILMAALLALASFVFAVCVCFANRAALKRRIQNRREFKALRSYGFIWALGSVLFCALSFLPKPLWLCALTILTLILCTVGTNFLALISVTYVIFINVCFHAMGLQMLLSLFALACAITVFFDKGREQFKIRGLAFVILLLQPLMAYAAGYPIQDSELTDFAAMLFTCEVISYIFLLFVSRYVCKNITYWLKDRYLLLNDQTYGLIQELKAKAPDKYEECLHGVYFTERVAKETDLDFGLVNAGMYYLYLGVLTEKNTDDEIKMLAKKHEFPKEMTRLLLECRNYPNRPRSPEATVVIITIVILRAVYQWLEKNKDTTFKVRDFVVPLCEKIYANGYLDDSMLSTGDWIKMKNVLINGGAYYEFIMRK